MQDNARVTCPTEHQFWILSPGHLALLHIFAVSFCDITYSQKELLRFHLSEWFQKEIFTNCLSQDPVLPQLCQIELQHVLCQAQRLVTVIRKRSLLFWCSLKHINTWWAPMSYRILHPRLYLAFPVDRAKRCRRNNAQHLSDDHSSFIEPVA